MKLICSDCGVEIGCDESPLDGWQLDDDRIVCNACCIVDTKNITLATIEFKSSNFKAH